MRIKLDKSKELTMIRSWTGTSPSARYSIHRAVVIGGCRIVKPELDESRRLKRIRSEAGDITLSQVYKELI